MPLATTPSRRIFAALLFALGFAASAAVSIADHTPPPASVSVPGSFNSEIGCPGDWQPDCPAADLTYNSAVDRWVGTFTIPAGSYEYKVAINDGWDENYGAGGVQNGPNLGFTLSSTTDVTFVYDPHTHVVTHGGAPPPSSVTLVGSLQSEAGCPGDWDPACATTHLTYDSGSDRWVGSFALPAGNYEYKVAINDSWDENYGAGGAFNGANIALNLAEPTTVTFSYDHDTHLIETNAALLVIAAGSFQSELGCAADWLPDCTNSQLVLSSGPDEYRMTTSAIPAGDYEFKVAIGGSWAENYGQNGEFNGPNVAFTVPSGKWNVTFHWDPDSHVPAVTLEAATSSTRASWGELKTRYR